jgi:hypothetical protein
MEMAANIHLLQTHHLDQKMPCKKQWRKKVSVALLEW